MEVNFKFELEQIVTTKESVYLHNAFNTLYRKESSMQKGAVPLGMQVVSRLVDECPGGIQLYYLCMYFTQHGYTTSRFNEETIVAYPELQPKP